MILTYLDSPINDVSPRYCLFFSISVIFRGTREVKVGPKVSILGLSLFHKNWNLPNIFQAMFFFARVLPLPRNSAILDYIWGIKCPKIP